MGSVLTAAGAAAGAAALGLHSPAAAADLTWEPLRNVQLGSSALRRVEALYPTEFCAYLARIMCNFDPVTRRWWAVQYQDADALLLLVHLFPDRGHFGSTLVHLLWHWPRRNARCGWE